jgi:hypothetical protein
VSRYSNKLFEYPSFEWLGIQPLVKGFDVGGATLHTRNVDVVTVLKCFHFPSPLKPRRAVIYCSTIVQLFFGFLNTLVANDVEEAGLVIKITS